MFYVSKIENLSIDILNKNKKLTIEKKKFNKLFILSFCITVHKSQGATFNEKCVIHEWHKFDKRLKYVAMSRSSNINNIIIN
jgi:ATP-dependent exoDNAse (exonuclease V) alpha subunit